MQYHGLQSNLGMSKVCNFMRRKLQWYLKLTQGRSATIFIDSLTFVKKTMCYPHAPKYITAEPHKQDYLHHRLGYR